MHTGLPIGGRRLPATAGVWASRVRRLLSGAWMVVTWLSYASSAGADARDSLRAAIHDAQQADFTSALEGFAAAEAGRGLARDDLVRLYAHRAVVHFAVGEREAMEGDLTKLLAVTSEAALPASAPPPVRSALQRLRSRGVRAPELSAHPVRADGGVRLMARARGGPAGLVRKVRVCARIRGSAHWACADRRIPIRAHPGVRIEWYAEVVGAGGAVLRRLGSAGRPRQARAGAS